MKRLAAILLLGILFFNWIGYRLLNSLMEDGATNRLEAQLERQQYDENQLITLKVPVTDLSYFNTSPVFERTTGQIEINGVPYRYVKRRIFNDSLEIQCIPNQTALRLRQTGNNYFQLVNDIPQNSKTGSHPRPAKSFSTDLFTCIQPIRMDELYYTRLTRGFHCNAYLPVIALPVEDRPPASAVA